MTIFPGIVVVFAYIALVGAMILRIDPKGKQDDLSCRRTRRL